MAVGGMGSREQQIGVVVPGVRWRWRGRGRERGRALGGGESKGVRGRQ